jgi:hypothetical protein
MAEQGSTQNPIGAVYSIALMMTGIAGGGIDLYCRRRAVTFSHVLKQGAELSGFNAIGLDQWPLAHAFCGYLPSKPM